MPGEDKKGPMGQGPRTGRGLGRCNSNDTEDTKVTGQKDAPRDFDPGLRRGPGRGMGRGSSRGPGRGFGGGPGQGLGRRPGRGGGRGFGRG